MVHDWPTPRVITYLETPDLQTAYPIVTQNKWQPITQKIEQVLSMQGAEKHISGLTDVYRKFGRCPAIVIWDRWIQTKNKSTQVVKTGY